MMRAEIDEFDDDDVEGFRSNCKRARSLRSFLICFGLGILLAAYLFLGAYFFTAVEKSVEGSGKQKISFQQRLEMARNQTVGEIVKTARRMSVVRQEKELAGKIDEFARNVFSICLECRKGINQENASLIRSFAFVLASLTTIGEFSSIQCS